MCVKSSKSYCLLLRIRGNNGQQVSMVGVTTKKTAKDNLTGLFFWGTLSGQGISSVSVKFVELKEAAL